MSYTFSVNSRSQASPGAVCALLIQPATWPSWSPLDAAEVEGGGDPAKVHSATEHISQGG